MIAFLIKNQHNAEQMTNINADAYITLPMPTKGDTIPPMINWKEPSTAEALPAFARSKFNAAAVAAGRIIALTINSMKNPTWTTNTEA